MGSQVPNKLVFTVGLLMFGVLGLQTLTTIGEAADERKQEAIDVLGDVGPQTVRIGAGEEAEDARDQMVALSVFNMMRAVDCRMVEDLDAAVADRDPVALGELEANPESTQYAGAYEGSQILLEQTDYQPACKGLDSVVYTVSEASPSEGFEFGESMMEEPSQDQEGRYGKQSFRINRTFSVPGDLLFLGYSHSFETEVSSIDVEGRRNPFKLDAARIPGFFAGKECSYMLPSGLNQGDDTRRESLYRFQFRTNAPLVVEETSGLNRFGGYNLTRLLSRSEFRFCDGASGYVISNAGGTDSTDEAGSENPMVEDVVYPLVQINEGRTSCLDFDRPTSEDVMMLSGIRDSSGDPVTCGSDDVGKTAQISVGEENSLEATCKYTEEAANFRQHEGTAQIYRPVLTFPEDACSSLPSDRSILGSYYGQSSDDIVSVTLEDGTLSFVEQDSASQNADQRASVKYSLDRFSRTSDIAIDLERNNDQFRLKFFDRSGDRIQTDRPMIKIASRSRGFGGNVDELNGANFDAGQQDKGNVDVRTRRIVVERGENTRVSFLSGEGDRLWSTSIQPDLREASSMEIEAVEHQGNDLDADINDVRIRGKVRGC